MYVSVRHTIPIRVYRENKNQSEEREGLITFRCLYRTASLLGTMDHKKIVSETGSTRITAPGVAASIETDPTKTLLEPFPCLY
jgi:hypothetical protein